MKKKITFTILDDFVSSEFLEHFGIDTDFELQRSIEPILGVELYLDQLLAYSIKKI